MEEHVQSTGDTGQLRIQDRSMESLQIVELWVRSLSPISIPNLPWARSIDSATSSWQSFNFTNTTLWQRLGAVNVGNASTFTLHLGNTGTSQLGGPTDFTINLAGHIPPPPPTPQSNDIFIKVGGNYRRAIPFVKDNGVWKPAIAYVRGERGWREIP